MSNILSNFPSVYYISLDESVDRRKKLHEQFKKYNIDNYTPILSKRFAECKDLLHGPYVHSLSNSNKGCTTSMLRAIRKWITETQDQIAVFCEDDISFSTVEYWSFTWSEFFDRLPADWECVQMMWVRPTMTEIKLRDRRWEDWAVSMYMMKRHIGIELLQRFYPNGDSNFYLDVGIYQPIVENIIYSSGKVYTIPLFVEEISLPTTSLNTVDYKEHLVKDGQWTHHRESHEYVMNWWINNGKNTSIEELMSI